MLIFIPHLHIWNLTKWLEKKLSGNHKDAVYYFEWVPEAASHKTAAVWPLTSHLTNHPSKTNRTCWALLEKQGRTHKWRSPVDSYTWTHWCWPISQTNIHTSALCGHWMPFREFTKTIETGGEKQRVKRILAVCTTWRWYLSIYL